MIQHSKGLEAYTIVRELPGRHQRVLAAMGFPWLRGRGDVFADFMAPGTVRWSLEAAPESYGPWVPVMAVIAWATEGLQRGEAMGL